MWLPWARGRAHGNGIPVGDEVRETVAKASSRHRAEDSLPSSKVPVLDG
jgi:hypothetical protein